MPGNEVTPNELTIIIPAYRCGRYLQAAARSAISCRSARILIAEDASGDETAEVARQIQRQFPSRVKLIENTTNLGMTANWRNAFAQVQTPWVLKLDGDDLINPYYVAAAIAIIRARPELTAIAGEFTEIGANDYLAEPPPSPPVPLESFTAHTGTNALQICMKWKPVPCSSSMIFNTNTYHRVGGFAANLHWCPDREIWFRLARCGPVLIANRTAAFYRILPESISAVTRTADRQCFELSQMLRSAKPFWPEPEARKLFRRAFARSSGSLVKSAWRAAIRGSPSEIPNRLIQGVNDLCRAARPK